MRKSNPSIVLGITYFIVALTCLVTSFIFSGIFNLATIFNEKVEVKVLEVYPDDGFGKIEYYVDDIKYTNDSFPVFRYNLNVGDTKEFYLDPSYPSGFFEQLPKNKTILPFVVLIILSLTFLYQGAKNFLPEIRKKRLKRILCANGYYVEANFHRIHLLKRKIYHKEICFLTCRYVDPSDGRSYIFESENFCFDPSSSHSRYIKVFVDENDYNRYYVDLNSYFGN